MFMYTSRVWVARTITRYLIFVLLEIIFNHVCHECMKAKSSQAKTFRLFWMSVFGRSLVTLKVDGRLTDYIKHVLVWIKSKKLTIFTLLHRNPSHLKRAWSTSCFTNILMKNNLIKISYQVTTAPSCCENHH